jgi:predicted RNA-binding Zn-ribbon protein involved in translation (DUF1610 family)
MSVSERKKRNQITEFEGGLFVCIDYEHDAGTEEPWVEEFKTIEEALDWTGWPGGHEKAEPVMLSFPCKHCGCLEHLYTNETTRRVLYTCPLCGNQQDVKVEEWMKDQNRNKYEYHDLEPTSRVTSKCPTCGNLKELPIEGTDGERRWAAHRENIYQCPVCGLKITAHNKYFKGEPVDEI